MTTPRHFDFDRTPRSSALYGVDPEFTQRTDSVAHSIYKILVAELKILRQVPSDLLDCTVWDLCYFAGQLVDYIPLEVLSIEECCVRDAPQLFKLATLFVEYEAASLPALTELESLIQYGISENYTRSLEAS